MLGIEIINICNYKCYFCDSQYVTNHKVMSNEKFFNIVDQAEEIGIKYLDLTPIDGELFIDIHFLEKLEYALPNFKIFFHTNFSLCVPEIQDKLKILQDKHNLEIVISDYYSEGLKAFNKLTSKTLKEYNIYQINIKYALSIGLQVELSYRGLSYDFTIDEDYKPDKNKKGICSLQYIPRVSLNGDVDYCLCGDGNLTKNEDLNIGNIYKTSLREVYYNNKRIELYKNQSMGIYNESCLNCDLFETGNIDIKILKHYNKMKG